MLCFIFKIISFHLQIKSSKNDFAEDKILNEFIKAFDDKTTTQKWLESRNVFELCALNLHENIIHKVRDILSVINSDTYKAFKSLIIETNMDFYEIGNTYYEIFHIISSVKRILAINNDQNSSNLGLCEEIIYDEYSKIYNELQLTIVQIGRKLNFNETLNCLVLKKVDTNNEFLAVTINHEKTTNLINSINSLFDSFLPVDVETPVNVNASLRDFRHSERCFGDEINLSLKGKHTFVCPNETLFEMLTRCDWFSEKINSLDIKKYMNESFLCNQTTAKILIILFHYYSEIAKKNTKYKIKLTKNNEYKIIWAYSLSKKLQSIKKYWLKKEITNFEKRKIIHKFGFIVDFKKEYSTIMLENTEKKPIKTRLILLTCGHLLGLELINEFLENFYKIDSDFKTCHICRKPVKILGSYNTNIYKYKN